MSPKVLDQVLRHLPRSKDKRVLVGFDTSDDAGVFRLSPECALVQTVDFFTPIVDDAWTFGAIAAANSLSDVYAMGGLPISSLSILCYPAKGDLDVLRRILTGGAEKMQEAGCALLGGHSVADDEVKFGYSVTGTVHPEKIWTNAGARPRDVLMLTKAIGTGVIATAQKQGRAEAEHVDAATQSMLSLNREAAVLLRERTVHGCTDVTGFGLLGHGREMALASGVTLAIEVAKVPLLPGAVDYSLQGAIPGGLKNNREFAGECVRPLADLELAIENLLYDPQTSGGLLLSVPEETAAWLAGEYEPARRIGRVIERAEHLIHLL